jgi:hypothetical protein
MSVNQLTQQLTQEELVGWAAFYELKRDEEEKAMHRAKTARRAKTHV